VWFPHAINKFELLGLISIVADVGVAIQAQEQSSFSPDSNWTMRPILLVITLQIFWPVVPTQRAFPGGGVRLDLICVSPRFLWEG
jgi:hypothetical protein